MKRNSEADQGARHERPIPSVVYWQMVSPLHADSGRAKIGGDAEEREDWFRIARCGGWKSGKVLLFEQGLKSEQLRSTIRLE